MAKSPTKSNLILVNIDIFKALLASMCDTRPEFESYIDFC